MRVFNLILTTGQLAGALTAFGVLCFGIWKYMILPAQQVAKVYKSIGKNGQKTVFENLHDIKRDVADIKAWRELVDERLDRQDTELTGLSVIGETLLRKIDP